MRLSVVLVLALLSWSACDRAHAQNSTAIDASCSESSPCEEGLFCEFDSASEEGVESKGQCISCPVFEDSEPIDCLHALVSAGNQYQKRNVMSCMEVCDIKAPDDGSKFSPVKPSGQDKEGHDDGLCHFCPTGDMQYPDRLMTASFGARYQCHQVDEFVEIMQFSTVNPNCKLLHSFNYICGCDGYGYAGATSHTKQAVLAWLPRVSAILSILVSDCILYSCFQYLCLNGRH